MFVLDFNKSDPIYLFLENSAKRNREVHRGHGFKKVSGLEFSTFGDCEINFEWRVNFFQPFFFFLLALKEPTARLN